MNRETLKNRTEIRPGISGGSASPSMRADDRLGRRRRIC